MVGSRIKELRLKLNLTQSEFAGKIGLKQAVIGMYESGSRRVTDRNILLICEKFSINENWLRTGNGEMFLKTPNDELEALVQKHNLDELDKIIFSEYIKMSKENREIIKNLIINIAGEYIKQEQHLSEDEIGVAMQVTGIMGEEIIS